MLDRLKLRLIRRLMVIIVAAKWWRRHATALTTEDRRIAGPLGEIGLRIYTPLDAGSGPLPLMLYLHGGGWVGCNLDTHDPLCRELCVSGPRIVVSVDYRLAPEHPFPAAPNDSLAALDWLIAHAAELRGDVHRLAVAGDSAGGNLAAVVAQQAQRRHPGVVRAQLLIYPVTDHYSAAYPSYVKYGDKHHALTRDGMVWMWDLYLNNSPLLSPGEVRHELATPLQAADLRGLSPAFVQLAEFDILKDEGHAYAQRLRAAGVDVCIREYAGQQHGFVGLAPTPACRQAVADAAAWLRERGL